ncbi:MAG: DUF503 domain-containing protein [Acidobacteria bacterium]|nr:MAG: DUF503 domain-containing protein [Acidobacteriota bacterium]
MRHRPGTVPGRQAGRRDRGLRAPGGGADPLARPAPADRRPPEGHAMVVGISVFEIHLPAARSLKQKRQVVRSLIERIHQRFRVSIAETGFHDLHQRAEIGIATIAMNETEGRRQMDVIRQLIDDEPRVCLLNWDPQLLEEMR